MGFAALDEGVLGQISENVIQISRGLGGGLTAAVFAHEFAHGLGYVDEDVANAIAKFMLTQAGYGWLTKYVGADAGISKWLEKVGFRMYPFSQIGNLVTPWMRKPTAEDMFKLSLMLEGWQIGLVTAPERMETYQQVMERLQPKTQFPWMKPPPVVPTPADQPLVNRGMRRGISVPAVVPTGDRNWVWIKGDDVDPKTGHVRHGHWRYTGAESQQWDYMPGAGGGGGGGGGGYYYDEGAYEKKVALYGGIYAELPQIEQYVEAIMPDMLQGMVLQLVESGLGDAVSEFLYRRWSEQS
jgi:hypothetical protein